MSQFVVSARKYRPLRFSEVVGQSHVGTTLQNAIRQNTLAHAFLFCGPRGVGKTTCARILAKVLNCQNVGDDTEPCGTCTSCESFDKNASLNIIELDAASNNSVEHIRSLTEQVRFQPQEGTYKVFIIDEVHMLSQQAFNAFLKTLEEPPSYAIFILATTEKHKIIPTILSRCQIFDFKRIQVDEIVAQLKEICVKEGIAADPDALHLIATKADGALRDALSIFDKIASYGGKKISYDDVIGNLNILDYDYFFKVVDYFFQGDLAGILSLFDNVQKQGFDGDTFINGLAEHLRNLLVCKHKSIHHLLSLSETLSKQYHTQAQLAEESFLLSALDLLNTCDIEYKMAKNKRLHVEMTLIKINYLQHLTSDSEFGAAEKKSIETSGTIIESFQSPASAPGVDSEKESTNPPANFTSPNLELPTKAEIENSTGSVEASDYSAGSEKEVKKEQSPAAEPKSDHEETASGISLTVPFDIKKPSNLSLGSLGTLDQIEKVVEARYSESRELETQVVTLDQVDSIWRDYANEQLSQTVKAVLERVQLDVKNNAIVATVSSEISKTVILQETALIDKLRSVLGLPRLTIKIEIDQNASDQAAKPKVLTAKEKFELLCDQNPYFKSFRDHFGLKLDRDQ